MTAAMTPRRFEKVLLEARAGEGWAFTALYEWLCQPITAFVVSRGIRDADPVVNETFLAAFRGLHRFDGGAVDFRKWTFGIARHKIADACRVEARQVPRVSVEAVAERAASDHVEDEVLIQLSNEEVAVLLSTLTDEQREVLVLRMVSDLTIAQIADVVEKPVGAVKALQRRALRRLASTMGDVGSGEVAS